MEYQVLIDNKKECFHCGDECISGKTIHFQQKTFCCEGCKSVFEIVQTNQLGDYYDLQKTPGVKLDENLRADKYLYLEGGEARKSFVLFEDNSIVKVLFYIPKIHCSSCVWLLENLSRIFDGIVNSRVDFLKKELTVTFKKKNIQLSVLAYQLNQLGYEPQQALSEQTTTIKDKSLYIKIGVAGFCFGNIMLFSFPEYLGLNSSVDGNFSLLFNYLNILLSLPVLLYCSSDYFKSAYTSIRKGFVNLDIPIAIGIVALFGRSLYEILSHTGTGYLDSLAGLLFFLLIGRWYQSKTYSALSFERDYLSYFPVSVIRIDEFGKEYPVLIKDIQVGDKIVIRNQEVVPVDSFILTGEASINYSFVTGESQPVSVHKGELVHAGGRQMGATIILETKREVSQSYLIQLWNQDVFKSEKKSQLSRLAFLISRNFTVGVLLISLFTFLYWWYNDQSVIINAVTSVLIVACPCALALTIPFSFGNSLRLLGRIGFFIKNTTIVESIASVDTFVFDKTGTITHADESTVEFVGKSFSENERILIATAAKHSTHPLSRAVCSFLNIEGTATTDLFEEIPGKGLRAVVEGKELRLGTMNFVSGMTLEEQIGSSRVHVSIDNEYKGFYNIQNKYREGIEELMQYISKKAEVYLLSGDNSSESTYLQKYFKSSGHMLFNQSPLDKLNFIKDLQAKGKKVMMLGDGLNDAGALKQSNVGVSVNDNVYNFSPSCDVIMEGKRLPNLAGVIQFSRKSILVVKLSLMVSLMYNAVGISFAVSGQLTPLVAAILMPLSSVSVVLFVVGMTNWYAKKFLSEK